MYFIYLLKKNISKSWLITISPLETYIFLNKYSFKNTFFLIISTNASVLIFLLRLTSSTFYILICYETFPPIPISYFEIKLVFASIFQKHRLSIKVFLRKINLLFFNISSSFAFIFKYFFSMHELNQNSNNK